jgi:hypothetical protein
LLQQLGAQRSFDWKGVAASAIASGAGYAAGSQIGDATLRAGASGLASGVTSTLVRGGSLQRNAAGIAGDTIGAMVAAQMADRSLGKAGTNSSTLHGPSGDVDAWVAQSGYAADPGKTFAWSANAQFVPAASSFDATAASLGLTPDQARSLMAEDRGASIVGDPYSPYTPGVETFPVSTPQITVRELPLVDVGGVNLAQTEGGFWRGLSGDKRSVFEVPAPLSEQIGNGVRSVLSGVFVDPLVELKNQYVDFAHSLSGGSRDDWRSGFGQAALHGEYGTAALTELGMVAGAAPVAGAALKGVAWALPAAGPMLDSYAVKTGMYSFAVEPSLGTAANFASEAKLIGHFEKHGAEFGASSASDYLQVGRGIIEQGVPVEYFYKPAEEMRTGYIQFMGNSSRTGVAKFGFVGTNSEGAITTIHTESGKSLWKMLNGVSTDKTIRAVR